MAIDGNYDGRITISNQGISQAICDELNLTAEERAKLGKSIWTQIFQQVDAQNEQGQIYEGGNDAFGDMRENYKVAKGQVISFSKDIWNNIVKIVNNVLDNKRNKITQDGQPVQISPTSGSSGNIESSSVEPSVKTPNTSQVTAPKITIQDENAETLANQLKEVLQANWVDQSRAEELLKQITPQNIAKILEIYPNLATDIDDVFGMGGGFDKDEVYEYVLKPLFKRAESLDRNGTAETNFGYETIKTLKDLSLDDMLFYINYNAAKVLQVEKTTQETINNANEFLAKVANTPNLEIKRGFDKEKNFYWANITLDGGKWVQVEYDSEGNITKVLVQHMCCTDKGSVAYNADSYICENSPETINDTWDAGTLYGSEDWEAIKAVVEQIFGKNPPNINQ